MKKTGSQIIVEALRKEGVDVIFSDNYFNIPAGLTIQVTAPLPSGWKKDQVRKALQLRSLYNTYA